MRAWRGVAVIGVVLTTQVGAASDGSFETCRAQLQEDKCAPCLADRPTSKALCDLEQVVDCLRGLQADVEWFDALVARGQAKLTAQAEQQARILDLLKRIRDGARDDSSEVGELVDKLREEVAGKETGGRDAAPSPHAWQILLPDSGVQGCSDTGERTLVDNDTSAYLFSAYHAYHNLKARLKDMKKAGATDLPAAFDQAERKRKLVRALMHRALRRKGFDEPIMGVLAGGLGFTRAPDKNGQAAAQSAQSLVVRFESKHLSVIGTQVDAGLMGKFGVQPSFDVLKPPDPSGFRRDIAIEQTGPGEFTRVTTEQSVVRLVCPTASSSEGCEPAPAPGFAAKYANSFVWDAGARVGVDLFGLAELSGFARAGQTHPLPDFVAVKNDAGQPVAAELLSTTSDSRWYQEFGGRFVVYRRLSNREAHEIGALTPLLEAEGGWRFDRRFEDRGDDFAVETFGNHPERRWFLRFALNGLPVLGNGDAPFLASFAVEWEGKRGAKGLASGTKIYVQGNLDLNKLFASK